MGLRSLSTHCSQEEGWRGEGVGPPQGGGSNKMREHLPQQPWRLQKAPHCKYCSPWRGKWKPSTEQAGICYFTDSLQECFPSPSLCAQLCAQLHCCGASSQVNCTCTLHHLFSCTHGLVLWVHVSFPLSSTATASKPSRSLTSPSLGYLCPPQL